MTFEPEAAGSRTPTDEPVQTEAKSSMLRELFLGPNGIRAGWRLLMFICLFMLLWYIVVRQGLRLIPGFSETVKQARADGVLTPTFSLGLEGAELIAVLLATWIMGRIEKRAF